MAFGKKKYKYTVMVGGKPQQLCTTYKEAKKYLDDTYGVDCNGNSLWENFDCSIVNYIPNNIEIED